MDSMVMEVSDKEDINFLTVSQSFENRLDFGNGVNMLPEELITNIFDYVEPYALLKLSEVCQKWNIIIKQPYLWRKKYIRKYKEQPQRHQWFVLFSMVTTDYYDVKPVHRGDAHNSFQNWTDNTQTDSIVHLTSPVEGFDVTAVKGRAPLNLSTISRCISKTKVYINQPEIINFGKNRLVTSIVNAFKPIVYAVEWSSFSTVIHICNQNKMMEIMTNGRLAEYCIKQAIESAINKKLTSTWRKKPIVITDYALLNSISFVHVISVNQPITPESLGNNLINVIERKPKIFACSLSV